MRANLLFAMRVQPLKGRPGSHLQVRRPQAWGLSWVMLMAQLQQQRAPHAPAVLPRPLHSAAVGSPLWRSGGNHQPCPMKLWQIAVAAPCCAWA